MKLTALRLAALAKNPVPGKHTDGQGLYLKVTPAGGMYWQWRVRTPRDTAISYGTYPEVSLSEARERHRQAREQRRNGLDPNLEKRKARAALATSLAHNFEAIAREWFAVRKGEWAPKHAEKVLSRLEKDVFPQIGRFPVTDVTPLLLLEAIRKIEARGVHETAHRARDTCSQVFRFAIATGRAQINPAADLRQALKTAPPVKHMPAVTDPAHLGGVLNSIERYKGSYTVRAALALTPMLLLRSGELRFGRWEEIDLEGALWTIPGERMKGKQTAKAASAPPHLVPLPRQAVEILRELHAYTGPDGLVFKSERDRQRAMSENTVNVALWALGLKGEQTGHGFRATARTLLAEVLSFDDNIIEAQLAHRVRDSLGRAYNRTQFVAQRRQMLQAWADYLDGLKTAPAASQPPLPGIGKGGHLRAA